MLTSSFHDDKADGWHSIFRRMRSNDLNTLHFGFFGQEISQHALGKESLVYSNPFECDGELFLGSSPSLSVSEREKVWQDRVTADLQLIRSASWCKLVRHGLRVEVVSKRV